MCIWIFFVWILEDRYVLEDRIIKLGFLRLKFSNLNISKIKNKLKLEKFLRKVYSKEIEM